MLTITENLPSGAIIGGEHLALMQALARSNGAWFAAAPDAVQSDGDRITGWRDVNQGMVAATTGPSAGNCRFDAASPAAFLCETGVACGFMIPEFTQAVDRFTAAVIYTSPKNEAKTLFGVSTGASRNVIFLSESEGALFAKDRHNTFVAEIPVAAQALRPRLAIVSYTGRGILLRSGGRTETARGRAPDMKHPAQFLIGCRTSRPGLAKTLGQSRLHDVLFWPDRALLASSAPEDQDALAALDRYHRWTC